MSTPSFSFPPLLDVIKYLPAVSPVLTFLFFYSSSLFLPAFILVATAVVFLYINDSFFNPEDKVYGVPVSLPGPGITYRNRRFLTLLDTPFAGANTIPAMFDLSAKSNAKRRFLGTRKLVAREMELDAKSGREFEKLTMGEYSWESYERVHERACAFGAGLLAAGHGKGDRLAIFAETRADWFIAMQGAFQHGIVVVTVYASLGEDALLFSLNQTKVTTVVCDAKQIGKLRGIAGKLTTVKRVVVMEEQQEESGGGGGVGGGVKQELGAVVELPFAEVETKGFENPVATTLPQPGDVALIMYTSGSTGTPKGVLMSHANLVAICASVQQCIIDFSPSDTFLAFLPLSHCFELAAELAMSSIGASIGYGTPLTLVSGAGKVKKGTKGDAAQLKPTLMAAVPAIIDRIRDGVRRQIESQPENIRNLFDFAYSRRLQAIEGSWLGAWGPERALYNAVIFKKIQESVGGRLRLMLSGGAPLAPESQRFMNICFDIPVGQGYGLTETCAGATFTSFLDPNVGRVGPPVPSNYVRLIDWEEGNYRVTDKPLPRGEIVIGGLTVTQGYFEMEDKAAEVFSTDSTGIRWFYTGDVGQVHPDGTFQIIDRKKDIVKLSAGEYVSLGKVEAVLLVSRYVSSIMMYAEAVHSYAIALVAPEKAFLVQWADSKGIPTTDFEALCANPEAVKEVLKSINEVAKAGKLAKFEVPAKIKLLPEPWTPESGLVTAALKVRRNQIRAAFKDDLVAMYK